MGKLKEKREENSHDWDSAWTNNLSCVLWRKAVITQFRKTDSSCVWCRTIFQGCNWMGFCWFLSSFCSCCFSNTSVLHVGEVWSWTGLATLLAFWDIIACRTPHILFPFPFGVCLFFTMQILSLFAWVGHGTWLSPWVLDLIVQPYSIY